VLVNVFNSSRLPLAFKNLRTTSAQPSQVDVNYRGKTIRGGVRLWMVGTDTAKSEIYNRLRLAEPSMDGYVHLSSELPEDFYKQLTAEKLATR